MTIKKTLPFFSYVLHPILVPLLSTLVYVLNHKSNPTKAFHTSLLVEIVVITILLPIVFFFILRKLGKVDSIMVSNIAQRKIPLAIKLFLSFYMIKYSLIKNCPELYLFYIAGFTSVFFAFILVFYNIKTSLHMLGSTALSVFILTLNFESKWIYLLFIILLIVNIILAFSRLEMKAHTPKELVIGTFVGILPQLFVLFN